MHIAALPFERIDRKCLHRTLIHVIAIEPGINVARHRSRRSHGLHRKKTNAIVFITPPLVSAFFTD
jgi:hypothetical protein